MASRSFIYFALMLATTAIAAPLTGPASGAPTLASREALPAGNEHSVADREASPDLVFVNWGADTARRALPASNEQSVENREAVPDIVFVGWGKESI
ncbi:hypothetical protein PG990_012129 [Apiospora arundinis]